MVTKPSAWPAADPDELDDLEPVLKLPEVCAHLGCGMTKLKGLLRTGELKSTKIGGTRVVRGSDLNEYIRSRPVRAYGGSDVA